MGSGFARPRGLSGLGVAELDGAVLVFHVDAERLPGVEGARCYDGAVVVEPVGVGAWRCPACGFTTAAVAGHC